MYLSLETVLLLLIIFGGWFWLASLRVRELAISAGQQAAQQYGVQFLDETVAFSRLRLARDSSGRVRFKRTYQFEVSDTGSERLQCSLVMLGTHLDRLDIPPYRDFTLHTIH
ncbi:MAG TPA: DUF3301 domain-containing protein [Methylophilaceae bacterium]|jgi:hypothetical protein